MTTNLLVEFNSMLLASAEAAPPLQFRVDTLLFSLLIFFGLLFLLGKFAWKPIMDGLEKRESNIAGSIHDAQSANEKAQALLAQYEQKLQAARDEASVATSTYPLPLKLMQ